MKKMTLLTLAIVAMAACTPSLSTQLDARLRQMEAGVKNQQPEQIAAIYTDDSYVVNPNKIEAYGRSEIDEYWKNLGAMSTDWKLESLVVSEELEAITQSEAWQALERQPRLPGELDIALPEGDLAYQLGRSHLTIEQNGEENTSIVTFLLIWKKVEGEYQIWMDTYS